MCAVLVVEAEHAVDKFHFEHNHKGAWCQKNVNSHSHPELNAIGNTSICEQRFKHFGRFKHALRYMNRPRFNWMLLVIYLYCCRSSAYRSRWHMSSIITKYLSQLGFT